MNIYLPKKFKRTILNVFLEISDNFSPICWSIKNNYFKMLDFLIKINADISLGIDFAAEIGSTEALKIFQKNGINITEDKHCLLITAVENGQISVVKLLLENGANINVCNNSCLYWAVRCGYSKILKLLIEHGANIYDISLVALEYALENNYVEVIKVLLNHKFKPVTSNIIYYIDIESKFREFCLKNDLI